MCIQSLRRSLSVAVLFALSSSSAWLGNCAQAQTLKHLDGAVTVFGQSSGNSSGNGVQDKPTESIGALASVRQSFHPWLGYEVNYGYTRFAERYNIGQPLGTQVQNNLHEVSVAYLLQGPTLPILGLQPFATVGSAALIFLPTTTGGQKYSQQTRVPLLYELGVNYPVLTSHLGLRFEYRGLLYKAPDFGASNLTTGSRRQTNELGLGAYFKF
jgi:opacity protein-like surface antigen